MSIKSKIDKLGLQERRQLAHAFDCGFSQYVIIPGTDIFIGVHLDSKRAKHLKIEEEIGVWCSGTIKQSKG